MSPARFSTLRGECLGQNVEKTAFVRICVTLSRLSVPLINVKSERGLAGGEPEFGHPFRFWEKVILTAGHTENTKIQATYFHLFNTIHRPSTMCRRIRPKPRFGSSSLSTNYTD
ncbi:hypothetical protein SCOR_27050 [Sulfidibacter corallicola]